VLPGGKERNWTPIQIIIIMIVHKMLRQKIKNVVKLLEFSYYVTVLLCVYEA